MKELLIFAAGIISIKLFESAYTASIEAQLKANPSADPVPPTWPYLFPVAAVWIAYRVGEGRPILSLKSKGAK